MAELNNSRYLFLYTMFSSLGDFIIIGDVTQKIERAIPGAQCLVAHRDNPHIKLWKYGNPSKSFFSIYRPSQLFSLISKLWRAKKEGYTVFGLQQAPGSLQGFSFHTFLKKMGALDYIVDFNLYNADIITPPEGHYILDLHLNQIKNLFKITIPQNFYKLELPIAASTQGDQLKIISKGDDIRIGIHPWSRRGHLPSFAWPPEKWVEVVEFLLLNKKHKIIIFGRDRRFEEFKACLSAQIKTSLSSQIEFSPSRSVPELIHAIENIDLLVSVNTSVVHIGYALNKKMVILCGPSLNFWTPKGKGIEIVYDEKAVLKGSDKHIHDERFPSISRIETNNVISSLNNLL